MRKLRKKEYKQPVKIRLIEANGKWLSVPEDIYENLRHASIQDLALLIVDPSENTRILAEWFLKRKT